MSLYPSVSAAKAALAADWRWPHFTITELACRCASRFCSGEYWHDPSFLDGLESLRLQTGRVLIVTSGHRCGQWNAAVGGAPQSQHKQIAVDVWLNGHDRHALRASAEAAGFTGIGLGKSFIHLDRRAVPAQWYYTGSKHLWQT